MKIRHICIECGKTEWREALTLQGEKPHQDIKMMCGECFRKKLGE